MSWVRGHFDLPATPDGTEMPQTAQLVATVAMAGLVAGFAVYAIREIAQRRSVTLALAVLLLAAGDTFTGWRAVYLLFLPMVCDAAGSVAVGWPIFSALNAQASAPVRWLAAALTITIGLAALDLLIVYAARTSAALEHTKTVGAVGV
jgi:hypothetical protein